ncbi:GNAT family N-acetyltransferase [Ulvibacter antarcticus]|uniref:Ribosomal protein S18 acetylase RimI-like enzyme n=1 Tax=Ulvibacter antarcticus TaxID=442714 RepID=A0A3L9YZS6_9FLAO|nr:GNAT family N-acetyltransferase [Ulvibacter antarcticus]RMA66083.1 ribosomal protein S18 acetylase RimI-like enzyme [Ulvibacter antarcticus]
MIRKAKQSEIEQIITITRACGAKMASEGIFQWNHHYPNPQAFQKDIERDELYVLLSEATIIGCMVISSEKDSEYNDITWLSEDNKQYYIHRVAIHPDFQKKGNAKRLMDFAETLAQENKITSIRLDTFSQNKRNQKFYEARGYTRLGNIYFPKQSEFPFYCYEKVM